MKIVHVARSLILNSGVSVFVAELAGAQAAMGHDVSLLYIWRPEYKVDDRVCLRSYVSLSELEFKPDVVHIHGVWSLDMVRAMNWCRNHNVRYIVSPHGGLMPRVFRKGWLKKRLFYYLFLRSNLSDAYAIHCTGQGEEDAVRSLGLRRKIIRAPLGCHLPVLPIHRITCIGRTVLFLSRISEEKGLPVLLDAWHRIPHADYKLVLAGPDWRGYRKVLEEKIKKDRIQDVAFVGYADSVAKDRLYRSSSIFVLPSPMENFSMVVLDALAYGLPVLVSKGTPWQSVAEVGCGQWVECDADAFARGLSSLMNMDDHAWADTSAKARRLAERFDWGRVAGELLLGMQDR